MFWIWLLFQIAILFPSLIDEFDVSELSQCVRDGAVTILLKIEFLRCAFRWVLDCHRLIMVPFAVQFPKRVGVHSVEIKRTRLVHNPQTTATFIRE